MYRSQVSIWLVLGIRLWYLSNWYIMCRLPSIGKPTLLQSSIISKTQIRAISEEEDVEMVHTKNTSIKWINSMIKVMQIGMKTTTHFQWQEQGHLESQKNANSTLSSINCFKIKKKYFSKLNKKKSFDKNYIIKR